MEYKISSGPAAAICRLYENNLKICEMTLDWSYDGIYFKYLDNDYMIISIGSKTRKNDLDRLDKNDIENFSKIGNYLIKNFQSYSEVSDKALSKLKLLID